MVAIPLFERFTALDAVGPYEVLQRVPTIDVTFVGHRLGEVRSDNGMLGLMVDKSFAEVPRADVVVFPGGIGTRVLIKDQEVFGLAARGPQTHDLHHSVLHRWPGAAPRPDCPPRKLGAPPTPG